MEYFGGTEGTGGAEGKAAALHCSTKTLPSLPTWPDGVQGALPERNRLCGVRGEPEPRTGWAAPRPRPSLLPPTH